MTNELTVDREAEIIKKINSKHKSGTGKLRAALQDYIDVGEMLLEVKTGLKHGMFGAWITQHCEFSYDSARQYIRAFVNLNRCSNNDLANPITTLRALADPTKEELQEVAQEQLEKTKLKLPEPELYQSPSGPASRPPCPGVEGTEDGQYDWSPTRGWVRLNLKNSEPVLPVTLEMSVVEAEKIMGIAPMPKDVLQAIFRYQASKHHPDKGGDVEQMKLINKAYERLQNDYY